MNYDMVGIENGCTYHWGNSEVAFAFPTVANYYCATAMARLSHQPVVRSYPGITREKIPSSPLLLREGWLEGTSSFIVVVLLDLISGPHKQMIITAQIMLIDYVVPLGKPIMPMLLR